MAVLARICQDKIYNLYISNTNKKRKSKTALWRTLHDEWFLREKLNDFFEILIENKIDIPTVIDKITPDNEFNKRIELNKTGEIVEIYFKIDKI